MWVDILCSTMSLLGNCTSSSSFKFSESIIPTLVILPNLLTFSDNGSQFFFTSKACYFSKWNSHSSGWQIQLQGFDPIFLHYNDVFLYFSFDHSWYNRKIVPPLKSLFRTSQTPPTNSSTLAQPLLLKEFFKLISSSEHSLSHLSTSSSLCSTSCSSILAYTVFPLFTLCK